MLRMRREPEFYLIECFVKDADGTVRDGTLVPLQHDARLFLEYYVLQNDLYLLENRQSAYEHMTEFYAFSVPRKYVINYLEGKISLLDLCSKRKGDIFVCFMTADTLDLSNVSIVTFDEFRNYIEDYNEILQKDFSPEVKQRLINVLIS